MSTVITTSSANDLAVAEDIDAGVLMAYRYLELKEERYKEADIAQMLGYASAASLYVARQRWGRSGDFEKARQMLLAPRIVAAHAASQAVYAQWPELLGEVIDIAKTAKSAKTRLEAVDWLYKNIVQPTEANFTRPGDAEAMYAQNAADLDPTMITLPDFLVEPRTVREPEQDHPEGS